MRRNRLILIGIPLLVTLGWLAFGRSGVPVVEVAHPARGPAVQAVYATGTVEATVMMPIASRMGARLMELSADEGSDVAKGQVLARLDDDELQHSLQQLQAKEAFAKRDYDRQQELAEKGIVTKEAVDRSRSTWEEAEAAVHATEAQLDYLKLTAPADGRIIRRDGEIGQLIPANQPVFWLSCCAPLRISAEVDEEDIALVAPGQHVLIRADAFPGETFKGMVIAITPKGDPVARSYRVRVGLEGETRLMIGMTAETNIVIRETDNALLVPAGAVQQDMLWKVENGTLKEVKISVGAKGQEQVEILGGIAEGDLIAVKPDAGFAKGKKVRTTLVPVGE